MYSEGMRTTLHIDDDVYRAAESLARAEGKSIGKTISALARKGLRPVDSYSIQEGFPVVQVAEDAKPITSEMVRQGLLEP
jgi:hypothetical protein